MEKEADNLKRWKSEFNQDYSAHRVWWNKKREWEKFYDGDQLSHEEKTELKKRGQPLVVINKIKPRVDSIVGDFLGRRTMMRARDKGSLDFEKAKHVTEALRYVEDMNRFDEQEFDATRSLLISGLTWYKISLEFDFLEPEIKISNRNNNDIILDRRCRRRDLKDAKRLYETVWVEVEDLIELYPDFEKEIRRSMLLKQEDSSWGSVKNSDYTSEDNVFSSTEFDVENYVDKERNRIRLINVWERVQKRIEFAFHPGFDGQVLDISEYSSKELANLKKIYPDAQYFTRSRWELNSGIFIADTILEDKKNVRPHDSEGKFPFARALANIESETNIPYGIVRQYVDPQKEYNKRRSKLLHKTSTNRIIAEEGAVMDIERTRVEAARPDGFILIKPGKQFNIDNGEPHQADVYLLQLSQSEIEDAGISKEFAGQENKVLSGKAIEKREVTGDKQLRQYYHALRSARRDTFEIVLEEIQQFWTSEKLVKITDDPNAAGIVLNQRVQDGLGNTVIINDLRLGKYDIKIDEDMETPNQRAENFYNLTQLAPAIIQSGQPFPIESLIQASELPSKNEIIQKISEEKQRQYEIAQMNLQSAQAQAIAAHAAKGVPPNGQSVSPT